MSPEDREKLRIQHGYGSTKKAIMDYLNRVQLALKTTFNPPDNATALQIRLYGLGAWLIGFIILVVLLLSVPVLEKTIISTELAMVYLSISFVAFGLMATGCYRALTGKNTAGNVNDYEVSLARVIKGLISILLSMIIPASIVLVLLYFLQWIGIEPNELF